MRGIIRRCYLVQSHSQLSGDAVESHVYPPQLFKNAVKCPFQDLVFLGHLDTGVLRDRFGQFLHDAIVNKVLRLLWHDVPPFAAIVPEMENRK